MSLNPVFKPSSVFSLNKFVSLYIEGASTVDLDLKRGLPWEAIAALGCDVASSHISQVLAQDTSGSGTSLFVYSPSSIIACAPPARSASG